LANSTVEQSRRNGAPFPFPLPSPCHPCAFILVCTASQGGCQHPNPINHRGGWEVEKAFLFFSSPSLPFPICLLFLPPMNKNFRPHNQLNEMAKKKKMRICYLHTPSPSFPPSPPPFSLLPFTSVVRCARACKACIDTRIVGQQRLKLKERWIHF